MARVLSIRATVGNVQVQASIDLADGYSPDLLDDLNSRVSLLMTELLLLASQDHAQAIVAMPGKRPLDWRLRLDPSNPPG